ILVHDAIGSPERCLAIFGRDRLGALAARLWVLGSESCATAPGSTRRSAIAPGTPAWRGAAATVSRALRLIERGFLDAEASVSDLADTLGMTTRHLRRLFRRHAGASPSAVATTRRVQRAKALVDGTTMSMSEIAFAAGFAS